MLDLWNGNCAATVQIFYEDVQYVRGAGSFFKQVVLTALQMIANCNADSLVLPCSLITACFCCAVDECLGNCC